MYLHASNHNENDYILCGSDGTGHERTKDNVTATTTTQWSIALNIVIGTAFSFYFCMKFGLLISCNTQFKRIIQSTLGPRGVRGWIFLYFKKFCHWFTYRY